MSEKTSDSGNPQRWWEGYLVRYFLGFIIGSICIATLTHKVFPDETSSIAASLFKKSGGAEISITPYAIGIFLLGIAYCYIASTPITVFHSTRMLHTWFTKYTRAFWFAWVAALVYFSIRPIFPDFTCPRLAWLILAVIDIGALLILRKILIKGEKPETLIGKQLIFSIILAFSSIVISIEILDTFIAANKAIIAFSLPTAWILIGQYWALAHTIKDTDKKFLSFYQELSKARQIQGTRDIRDSYTHLREHANSVFVVLIELTILAALMSIQDITKEIYSVDDASHLRLYLGIIFIGTGIWLVPTMFMWSLANRLERDFSKKPHDFVTDK